LIDQILEALDLSGARFCVVYTENLPYLNPRKPVALHNFESLFEIVGKAVANGS
jgi:hypothetical protein